MTEKYVKLADVKRKVNYILTRSGCSPQTQKAVKDAINNLPYTVKAEIETTLEAADVQPVRRGEWKATMMSEATGWDLSLTGGRDKVCEYYCSVCGQANILDEFGRFFLPAFCPNCGAKMSTE